MSCTSLAAQAVREQGRTDVRARGAVVVASVRPRRGLGGRARPHRHDARLQRVDAGAADGGVRHLPGALRRAHLRQARQQRARLGARPLRHPARRPGPLPAQVQVGECAFL